MAAHPPFYTRSRIFPFRTRRTRRRAHPASIISRLPARYSLRLAILRRARGVKEDVTTHNTRPPPDHPAGVVILRGIVAVRSLPGVGL